MPKPSSVMNSRGILLLDVGHLVQAALRRSPSGTARRRPARSSASLRSCRPAPSRPPPCRPRRPARRRWPRRCGAPRAAGSRRPPSGTCSPSLSLDQVRQQPAPRRRAGRGRRRRACPPRRQELPLGVAQALGDDDRAVAVGLDALVDAGEELLLVEGDFGEQDHVRGVAVLLRRQSTGGRDPAGVPSHHLQDEHLGRGLGHRSDVETRLADGNGDVLGDRAEAGAGVGDAAGRCRPSSARRSQVQRDSRACAPTARPLGRYPAESPPPL